MTTAANYAIVRKRCTLNGRDYNVGEYLKKEEFEKIDPQRTNTLFFTGILIDVTPISEVNHDSIYETRINMTLNGVFYKGGDVIDNKVLKTLTPYHFQSLINCKYIAKVSNNSYKAYENSSFRHTKKTNQVRAVAGKICTKCKETKPIIEFYSEKRTRGRSRSYCKSCYKTDVTKNRQKKVIGGL